MFMEKMITDMVEKAERICCGVEPEERVAAKLRAPAKLGDMFDKRHVVSQMRGLVNNRKKLRTKRKNALGLRAIADATLQPQTVGVPQLPPPPRPKNGMAAGSAGMA